MPNLVHQFIGVCIAALLLTTCNQKTPTLTTFYNYPIGLAKAKEENKPIFIHFTGFGCVGYNELICALSEHQKVQQLLYDEYIFIELYVDDSTPLEPTLLDWVSIQPYPDTIKQQFFSCKSNGQFNTHLEKFKFNRETQPLYVILDANEKLLMAPFGYLSKNANLLIEKLERGLTIT